MEKKKVVKNLNTKREKHYRNADNKKYLKTRITTIEGQLRGINKMIAEDQDSVSVIIQILASTKSLKSVANEIIREHFNSLISDEVRENSKEEIDMLLDLLKKMD